MTQIELDENLIAEIAAGNAESFRKVYKETGSAVYGLALSILKNRHDAEDVMHDAFLKIHEGAKDYQPMGKPLAWIFTIVRNLCYNRLRGSTVFEELDSVRELADENARIEIHTENRLMIDTALAVLDDQDREIVMLHAMAGWKHRETARFLELPVSTVLSKYNRALKKMRTALEGKMTGS